MSLAVGWIEEEPCRSEKEEEKEETGEDETFLLLLEVDVNLREKIMFVIGTSHATRLLALVITIGFWIIVIIIVIAVVIGSCKKLIVIITGGRGERRIIAWIMESTIVYFTTLKPGI